MAQEHPDELYTLRAQFMLGHYPLAVQEAKQLARRPLTPQLKAEREEFLMRAYAANGEYDKVVAGDTVGLQAIALKAQYDAAAGDTDQQARLVDALKTLAVTGGPTAQLMAAQVCLAQDQVKEAYHLVASGATLEHSACKLVIFLHKLNRLDLAREQLKLLKQADEESVLSELASVYVNLYTGKSTAGDAEHTLTALCEQYGPSVLLLNLLATALALQGDYAAAETKLAEARRDFAAAAGDGGTGAAARHETLINLATVQYQQSKGAEATQTVQTLLNDASAPSGSSLAFGNRLSLVTSAFDREAAKYKV